MLAEIPDAKLLPGFYSYPFTLQLPDWLPSAYLSLDEGKNLGIRYELMVYYDGVETTRPRWDIHPATGWENKHFRESW